MAFEFDVNVICPDDPTATADRVQQYKDYYKVKYDVCHIVKPSVIMEIGVRAGYSAWAFLQASPKAKYFGFDCDSGKHGGQGGETGVFRKWATTILKPYNVSLIKINTQTIHSISEIGIFQKADLFHIDGDHSYDGVINDLHLAYKSTNHLGLILIDDIDYIPEVREAVKWWVKIMGKKVIVEYKESLRGECLIWRV